MTAYPQKAARPVLFLAAAASVGILAARAALGPFSLPVFHTAVNSPFVAESVFWFALLGMLAASRAPRTAGAPAQPASPRFPWLYLAAVLALVALAFAHNLADPFLSDDYIIAAGPPFHWNTFLAALHRPGGDGSYRPLGTVYYQFLIAFAGVNTLLWHLAGLALHLLNCALVFLLAWQLWRDPAAAPAAALIFGLHGTRPEAALWSAGNCDLLACACVLAGISLALSRRDAAAGRARLPLALALAALGILFKESAYAMPLVAGCLLWPRRRALVAGCCAVGAVLFAWRWRLFHGPGGYLDPATGRPAILSLHPLTAAKAVLIRMWDILLAPVNWDAPRSWWLPAALAAAMLGLFCLAALSRAGGPMRFRLMAAACCALLPAIHLALIGQSGLGSRILYLPGALFALFAASLTRGSGKRGLVLAAVMIAGMAGILEHNLSAWHAAASEARALCRAEPAPASAPGTAGGVFLFQNGFAECVALARRAR